MSASVRAACIAMCSALGAFLFGLGLGYIAPILECASFKRDVGHLPDWRDPHSRIPDVTVGFIVGVFSIGCITTSFPAVSGYFLDEWGRRSSIMLGAFIFALGSGLQAVASSMGLLLFGRLVTGMSIGLLSTVVTLYQSELAPPSMRGALTSLYQLMITFGILVAAVIDHLLVRRENGWRWAIALQLVPAGVLLLVMPLLPRSPRWLVKKGRQAEALQALRAVREEGDAQRELKDIVESLEKALALGKPRWSEFFQGRVGRLLLLGVTLQVLQQLVGMNAFMFFGPRIFASLGLDVNLFQTITNAVNFVATFPAILAVDHFGRRALLICSAIGMLLACTGIGTIGAIFFRQQPDGTWTSSSDLAGLSVVGFVFFFVVNFAYGWGPAVWIYNSEIFPLKHRSWCVGTTGCANWVGNYVIAQFTPMLLGRLGFGTFFVFAVFTLAALRLAMWLPETKGVMLEHMDEIFERKFGRAEKKKDLSSHTSKSPGTKTVVPPVQYGSADVSSDDSEGGLVQGRPRQ